jgi:hypothetical protein
MGSSFTARFGRDSRCASALAAGTDAEAIREAGAASFWNRVMSHRALAFETAKRYAGDGGHNRIEDVPNDAFAGPIVAARRYDPMRQLPPYFHTKPFHPMPIYPHPLF